MKYKKSAMGALASLLFASGVASAQPQPTPEETNILILVDVSGSMEEDMGTSGKRKIDVALERAIAYVNAHQSDVGVEFALWAFDSGYTPGGYKVLKDFPGTAADIKALLGANGTPSPDLTPKGQTPLARAGCAAAGRLAADRNTAGVVTAGGYEWDKMVNGRKIRIARRLHIETDGLENAGADGTECAYTITSNQPYTNYESTSWQFKLRNKLLTGNANTLGTANNGLVVDVNLVFENWLSGLSGYSSEQAYAGQNYATPTLAQAVEFYSKLSEQTGGAFATTTVDAAGQIDPSRYPGDVDYSGCVSDADYYHMMQWYGMQVDPMRPHSYWPDLNSDGWVDDLDYVIMAEHWGEGPTCP